MLASEGLVLGFVGVLVGLASGAIVSLILIYVVNRQSFHWSMDVFVPTSALVACSVILVGAAALIAVISGRNAMGTDVVSAVKEDW
jgi:putative ABC transport system permease protein